MGIRKLFKSFLSISLAASLSITSVNTGAFADSAFNTHESAVSGEGSDTVDDASGKVSETLTEKLSQSTEETDDEEPLMTATIEPNMAALSPVKAASSTLVYGSGGTITKAEWLHDLAVVFDMTVEDGVLPDNYFADIDEDYEYYADILLNVEFGVIDLEAGSELKPDEEVTRDFAATTLNFCLGFQLDEDPSYTFSESTNEAYSGKLTDYQVALNREWFALIGGAFSPETKVTSDEAKAMLDDAAALYTEQNTEPDTENEWEFASYVIDLTSYAVEFSDIDTVVFTGLTEALAEGDTFAVVYDEMPLVYNAERVTKTGEITAVETSDAPDDAIVSMNYHGTVAADLADFVPAEGVEVTAVTSDEQAQELSKNRGITITNNSVVADMTLSVGGTSAKLSAAIKNVNVYKNIDALKGKVEVNVSGDIETSITLTGDVVKGAGLKGSIPIGTLKLGPISVGLYADLALSGKVVAVNTNHFSAGFSYKVFSGIKFNKTFAKKSFSMTAELNAKVGASVRAKLNLAVVKGEVFFEAGASAKVSSKNTTENGKTYNCSNISAWLYAGAGANVDIDVKLIKYHWDKSFPIYDEKNSPYRLYMHFEDGRQVNKCTRTGGGSSSTAETKYTSPSTTRYGTYWQSSVSSAGCAGTFEYAAPVNPWDYELDDDGNAVITKYNGYSSTVVIPEEIDGYKVVKIGGGAFEGNTSLYMVVIPDTVVEIGDYAFANCTKLSSVTLSKNLVKLSNDGWGKAFKDCTSLKSITIPKSLEKSHNPFEGSGLKNATFEKGVTMIVPNLFGGAENLETIDIPDTVTKIGGSAFADCTALTTVTIPDSVIEIGDYAFAYCTKLSSVTLSKNLVKLSNEGWGHAFKDCTSLTSITIPKSLEKSYRPFEDSGLKNVTFEKGVTSIPTCLFEGAKNLETIEIPDTVTSIGGSAFADCTALTTVTISDSVIEIGSQAFRYCSNLSNVSLPNNLTKLGEQVFLECYKVTSIKIPKSLEEGYRAFRGSGLKNVEFEKGITTILSCLFEGVEKLETIVIP